MNDTLMVEIGCDRGAPLSASELLCRELGAGPRPAADLRSIAVGAGIPWRTLQGAAQRLGVQRTKLGMTDGWLWALPREDASEGARGGESAPADEHGLGPVCLAAFQFEVPSDGAMHAVPTWRFD